MRAALIAGLMVLASAQGQQMGSLDAPAAGPKQHVLYVAEAQTIAAGKRAVLELKFRVEDGFHVNSHKPKSELQIPTALELGQAQGVKMAAMEYPAGKEFSFAFDPTEKLDVYSDEFVVKVPVTATMGEHEIKGSLRYQACDKAACFPPRTLAVDLVFVAK